MRIAVIGSTGLLGSELCQQCGNAIPLSRPAIDLTKPQSVVKALADARPDVVINAAAFTHVDRAESEPDLCRAINADGVCHLVDACRRSDCKLVQVSTDYVFGGDTERRTPYLESDPTSPMGIYAKSKLAGEEHARRLNKHLIVRTCGIFGQSGTGTQKPNFVDTMLCLGRKRNEVNVIDDQTLSPSYAPHIARAILFLTRRQAVGTYHVVNAGESTWRDLAVETFCLARLDVRVNRVSTEQYGLSAPRPRYSVLDMSKYQSLCGPPLPTWREALAEYVSSLPLT